MERVRINLEQHELKWLVHLKHSKDQNKSLNMVSNYDRSI